MISNLPGNPSINPHLPIPHFRYFCQKVLPAVYDDSLSYYELLCKLTAKINEVIVANEDELGAIKELQDLYIELKNYIDSYFKNLDLQKEIDIKLDEMGANGELSEYISMYLSTLSTFAFKNVAEMKNADTIGLGAVCRTLGTTDYKTGDGHYYIVRRALTTDVFDDINLVVLKNPELVAELIPNYFDDDLMNKINSNTQKITEIENKHNSDIGGLQNLNTQNKDNIVNSINEVQDSINQTNINLGDLNELTTNTHDSCVGAINTINTGLSDLNNRVVPVSLGGTGATDSSQALSNLGASPLTHKHSASDINSGVLPIARGGTASDSVTGARRNLDVLHRAYLYSNASASRNTITLSDVASNYSFIEIFYKNVYDSYYSSVKVENPQGKSVCLQALRYAENVMIYSTVLASINNNTITFERSATYGSSYGSVTQDNYLGIYLVIGYQY